MTEEGVVVKTEGKFATVRIEKKEECAKCGMCLFSGNANFIEFRATNAVGARNGDTVIIENSGEGKLLSSMLLFLVPLLLIGVAVAIGIFALSNNVAVGKDLWIAIISVGLIAIWYVILALLEKKFRKNKKFRVDIVQITKLAGYQEEKPKQDNRLQDNTDQNNRQQGDENIKDYQDDEYGEYRKVKYDNDYDDYNDR